MKENRKEISIALILIILLIVLLNPGDFLMLSMNQMLVTSAVVVVFAVFSILIWRERGGDERDHLHRLLADRVGYLLGSVVLVVAIIVQSFSHGLDPWLPVVLGALVIGKVVALMHGKNNN